ncbi:uncharacterized mitochondrial protein AtMg00810-like [Hibiscus syriacus]|uniref:uncharacterized mitochondrial protein AtMg00810-like n=1 Tax=Hibiscus syriacus TaxID=106335 RepID=UPI001924B043|nr:uncharacterized mitochondrial protein AtMg00810-like [Hibiscus syriacus]
MRLCNSQAEGKLLRMSFEQYGPDGEKLVCQLRKAIYGFKKARRSCLLLMVYVDDIIITGSVASEVNEVVKQINDVFRLKDLRQVELFLGMEISQDSTGLSTSNLTLTPMVITPKLKANDGSIVGGLQYVTLSRPDIAYAINKVSQYMNNPCEVHWKAVKRILCYLCGTIDHGLYYQSSKSADLVCYVDANWAASVEDLHFSSGFCIYFGGILVFKKEVRGVSIHTGG